MFHIPIFRAEADAGLEPLIQSTAKVCIASQVKPTGRFPISEKALAKLQLWRAKASVGDDDLFYLNDILVTTGWNKNDDVFDPFEMWVARATPTDKPFNYEHDCKDIIGHTVGCKPITVDGKDIPDNTLMDDLPAKYHILAEDVIYKYWEDKTLQERMDKVLADIQKNKWFVSMECLFKGFDYAMMSANGSTKLVARNEKTAFLTKHLRIYGGDGKYGEYRVGRLLRNILFSAKGLVHNPANPESIILDEPTEFSASKAESLSEFQQVPSQEVYLSCDGAQTQVTPEQESKLNMATEIETVQKKLDVALAEIETLKTARHELDVKAIASAKAKAEADVAELTKKLEDANKVSAEAVKASADQKLQVDTLNKQLEDATKALAEVKGELKDIFAEQKKAARIAKVKAALKVDEKKEESVKRALTLAESLMDLPDDKFDVVVKTMSDEKDMMTDTPATNCPADGNTTFTTTLKVTEVPKATDKPTGDGVTKLASADDGSDAAAAGADTKVLDTVVVDKVVALSTVAAGDGVKDVAREIATAFGWKAEE